MPKLSTTSLFPVVVAIFLLPTIAQAATVEVNVTIKTIDVTAREITVVYETKSWQKTMQLVVAPKADITVDGKPGTLESLKPDQKATVLFDTEILVATKVVVNATGHTERATTPDGDTRQRLSISEITEIKGTVYAPCLSEDGLSIHFEGYFDGVGGIYAAHRRDALSPFENVQRLFDGRHPAITNDGLEMILVGSPRPKVHCLCSALRKRVEEAFGSPQPILELRDPPDATAYSRNPYLSSDGLRLYFQHYPGNGQPGLFISTRPDRHSPWSKPTRLAVKDSNLFNGLSCPCEADGGMTLFCITEGSPEWLKVKGNLLKFTRSRLDEPFADPQFVQGEGLPPLIGKYPRYVSATKEMFFSLSASGDLRTWRPIIITNFVP